MRQIRLEMLKSEGGGYASKIETRSLYLLRPNNFCDKELNLMKKSNKNSNENSIEIKNRSELSLISKISKNSLKNENSIFKTLSKQKSFLSSFKQKLSLKFSYY